MKSIKKDNSNLLEFFGLNKYNISKDDIVNTILNCKKEQVQPNVIITPVWRDSIFRKTAEKISVISENLVYEITYKKRAITFIRSGIGAAQTGDVVLSLGCTSCKNLIFTGSAGAINKKMKIGDFIIPNTSIASDGFSKYLNGFNINNGKTIKVKPNPDIQKSVYNTILKIEGTGKVSIHTGPVLSVDSIISQFRQLNVLKKKYKCIGIEMETAAVFTAAKLVNINAGALLQVSDVVPMNKTLFSGRSKEEMSYRNKIRETVLARAVLESFN
jgi:purine-nucleoside phosphorylase